MSTISALPKPFQSRLSGFDFLPTFTQLIESIAFGREPELDKPAPQRNVEPLVAFTFGSIKRVIVGFRIHRAHRGWLVAGYADHGREPFRDIIFSRSERTIYIGEQVVVVPLQLLMQAGVTPKIERQLCRTDPCDGYSDKVWWNTPLYERIRDRSSTEQYHEEVEPTVPFLEMATHRRMVESVTQHVKADILEVHIGGYFPGLGALGFGVGWRGPTPSPTPMRLGAGWRGPRLLSSYSDILIVLSCCSHERAIGADSRVSANRHRYYSRRSGLKSSSRALKPRALPVNHNRSVHSSAGDPRHA